MTKTLRTAEEFKNAPPGCYVVEGEAAAKVAEQFVQQLGRGFSNKTIQEPTHGKPHICKRAGWWRVSPWKRRTGALYYKAHDFARKLNDKEQSACSKLLRDTKHDVSK